ncbi:MAG: hypothetical protein MRY78_09510 [Saprospiraceae bacterium]|nr:hypothetical protein [Saprospiraceae bacterium]
MRYFVFSLLLCGIILPSCQEDSQAGADPEEVIRLYQGYIDKNEFAEAKRLSTVKEQMRLVEIEKIIKEESARDPEAAAILHTAFHTINCEVKEEAAICICDLEDEYERYKQEFRLVRINNSWKVDAPEEEIIIDDEIIQDAIDSLNSATY